MKIKFLKKNKLKLNKKIAINYKTTHKFFKHKKKKKITIKFEFKFK